MNKPKLLLLGLDGVPGSYVREQVQNGRLSGFAKLMKQGVFFNDMMSPFPTITPTCWNTIYTGAQPKVHGAVCEMLHYDKTQPWEFSTSYSSFNIRAERFWDAAAKEGKKTLIIEAPASGATGADGVTRVLNDITTTPDKPAAETELTGVPQQYYSVRYIDDSTKIYASGAQMPSGGWHNTDSVKAMFLFKNKDTKAIKTDANEDLSDWKDFGADNARARQINENTFEFDVITDVPRFNPKEVEAFTWTIIIEEDGIRIGEDEASAKLCPVVGAHKWSGVLTRRLMTESGAYALFHFRAYCEVHNNEENNYTLYITAARNLLKDVCPADKAEDIMKIPEIHTVCWGDFKENPDKCFESIGFSLSWKKQILLNAIEKQDYDILFVYEGLNDTVNHYEMAALHGVMESEILTHERAVRDYERAYKLVDDFILWLYDNIVGENTTFAVFADHGGVGTSHDCSFMEVLKKAGLTTYTTDDPNKISWKNQYIDWSKTKAYCVGSCFVNVNLAGREPCGIVPPEEYDEVVKEIIRALQMYTETPDGRTRGLAFAVPGDQAGFIGQGGPCCGDVVFGIIGSELGGYFGGVHAVQIPSANTKVGGDLRPVCIMSGEKFKEDFILERPTDLTDIAPTLCYAMGYPQPKDATGGVVFAAYKETY